MDSVDTTTKQFLFQQVNASAIVTVKTLQSVWGGHGQLLRLWTDSPDHPSVVLKNIQIDDAANHPRGWNTQTSIARKIKSYQIECNWYEHYANHCPTDCRIPHSLGVLRRTNGYAIIMEDLCQAYPLTLDTLEPDGIRLCLVWLANFHAHYLGRQNQSKRTHPLWPIGTYWHLATRQDEYHSMPKGALKSAASAIDHCLNNAKFQTLVHGDAKVANFRFNEPVTEVAAVDFQYVGLGCGIKDVVYLFSSCLSEEDWAQHESELLGFYFDCLSSALTDKVSADTVAEIRAEWSRLYAIAWADFMRFLMGWSPGHRKLTSYAESLTQRGLAILPSA